MRRRLLDRGAAGVSVVPIWTPHWLLAGTLGFGPLLRTSGIAIAAAYRRSGREPIIVVGHSAGGLLARLAMCVVPLAGRVAAVQPAVGALVTLGTPHGLAAVPRRREHAGHVAVRFLDATNPGAFFAPRTGYLTVAGGAVQGGSAAARFYGALHRSSARSSAGDGLVPIDAAHLPGARHLTLPDVRHGHWGSPWYGDAEVIDRWWPEALDVWRSALEARRVLAPARHV